MLYAPAYAFAQHTNLGAGKGLQNKRKPLKFNYALESYRLGTAAADTAR